MEPRQGGRFHIWHMLTREMPFCNLCASKDGTFERENCAPKRPARFQGLDLASAISSAPETITRPFLTAARLDIPAVPRIKHHNQAHAKQKVHILHTRGKEHKSAERRKKCRDKVQNLNTSTGRKTLNHPEPPAAEVHLTNKP